MVTPLTVAVPLFGWSAASSRQRAPSISLPFKSTTELAPVPESCRRIVECAAGQ